MDYPYESLPLKHPESIISNIQFQIPHLYIICNFNTNPRNLHLDLQATINHLYKQLKCIHSENRVNLANCQSQLKKCLINFLKEVDNQNSIIQLRKNLQTQSSQNDKASSINKQKYFCNIFLCGNIESETQIREQFSKVLKSECTIKNINIQQIYITNSKQLINYLISTKKKQRQINQRDHLNQKILEIFSDNIYQQSENRVLIHSNKPNNQLIILYTTKYIYGDEGYLKSYVISFCLSHVNRWFRKYRQYLEYQQSYIQKPDKELFYSQNSLTYKMPVIKQKMQKMDENIKFIVNKLAQDSHNEYRLKYMLRCALNNLEKILPLFSTQYLIIGGRIYKQNNSIIDKIGQIKSKIDKSYGNLQKMMSDCNMEELLQSKQVQQAVGYIMKNDLSQLNVLLYISIIIWNSHTNYPNLQDTMFMLQNQEQESIYQQNRTFEIKLKMKETDVGELIEQFYNLTQQKILNYCIINKSYLFGEVIIDQPYFQKISQQNICTQNYQNFDEGKLEPISNDRQLQQVAQQQHQILQVQIVIKLKDTSIKKIFQNKIPSLNFIPNKKYHNRFYVIIHPFQFLLLQEWDEYKISFFYKGPWHDENIRSLCLSGIGIDENYLDSGQSQNNQSQYKQQPKLREQKKYLDKDQQMYIMKAYLKQKLQLEFPLSPNKDMEYIEMIKVPNLKQKSQEIIKIYLKLSVNSRLLCNQRLLGLACLSMEDSNYYEASLIFLLVENIYKEAYKHKFERFQLQAVDIAYADSSAIYQHKISAKLDKTLIQYSQICIKIGKCYLKLNLAHKNLEYLQDCIRYFPIFYRPEKYLYHVSKRIYKGKLEDSDGSIQHTIRLYMDYIKAFYQCGECQISLEHIERLFSIVFTESENYQWVGLSRQLYSFALLIYAEILNKKYQIQSKQNNLKNNTKVAYLRKQVQLYQKWEKISFRQSLKELEILDKKCLCYQALQQWYSSLKTSRQIILKLNNFNPENSQIKIKNKLLLLRHQLNQAKCVKQLGDMDFCLTLYQKLIEKVEDILQLGNLGESYDCLMKNIKTMYTQFYRFLLEVGELEEGKRLFQEWVYLFQDSPEQYCREDWL